MNKYFFILGIVCLISCSKNENIAVKENENENSKKMENVDGSVLIERSDCAGCHQIDSKTIGPSYQEIAGKYSEKDIDLLASKIINGGQGVWGEIPMTPHPQISNDDAKKMVSYILTLKK